MKTFELEEYYFHYINEYNVTVLCMTDKKMEKRLAFAFLQDVKKTLLEAYSTRELQLASQNSLTAFRDQIRDKTVSRCCQPTQCSNFGTQIRSATGTRRTSWFRSSKASTSKWSKI